MPIRRENYHRYPGGSPHSPEWLAIRRAILERAGNRCEGSPKFPDCRAEDGKPHPVTGSKVKLTVAHLDHMPEHSGADNLRAWCQECHKVYDARMRAEGRKARTRAKLAVGDLFTAVEIMPAPDAR